MEEEEEEAMWGKSAYQEMRDKQQQQQRQTKRSGAASGRINHKTDNEGFVVVGIDSGKERKDGEEGIPHEKLIQLKNSSRMREGRGSRAGGEWK